MKAVILALMMVLCIALIVLLKFGFMFLLLAMLPSIVAYYVDNEPRKLAFKIVFAGNFCASLPTLVPMLKTALKFRHYDVDSAFSDPMVWMFIYMGAGAGWCLIFLCRWVARILVAMNFENKIKNLNNNQAQLLKEWGDSIVPSTAKKKNQDFDDE